MTVISKRGNEARNLQGGGGMLGAFGSLVSRSGHALETSEKH